MKSVGDLLPKHRVFANVEAVVKPFRGKEFEALSEAQRFDRVFGKLLELIAVEKEPCFLLSPVLDFLGRVGEAYVLNRFELWLNQNAGLSFEENYRVRAKIAGKWIERCDYQVLFPIGTGKVYEGPHFVTAHKSPDLDTTVASFWGWLDAFAARVCDGLHFWNVPGGPPASQIEIDVAFRDVLGPAVFTHLPKTRTSLTVTGLDLMTHKGFLPTQLSTSLSTVDHDRDPRAIVLVDDEGFYLGDWRSVDIEGVRGVILLLSSCLRWFENNFHLHLIGLFAKEQLAFEDLQSLMRDHYGQKVGDCEPARKFSTPQRKEVSLFLTQVLGVSAGLEASFEALGLSLAQKGMSRFPPAEELFSHMQAEGVFDKSGRLVEERPRMFHFLERSVRALHEALMATRDRLERFDVALGIKQKVFKRAPTYVSNRAEVEEIRSKMGDYAHLTVAHPDGERLFPMGVVMAADVRKQTLGTVSLRDFCNREEMGIPDYLEVISVIDHHKSTLQTLAPPLAVIRDAQSCNTLVAERAFLINDRYATGGRTTEMIDHEFTATQNPRILRRLLTRRMAAQQKGSFYVHPERELLEYFHFLYGILDDTDLLTKVTSSDVECVVELLNRLKSLQEGKEVEVLHLEDLPRDKSFAKKAAQRILQNDEMYSVYRKVYAFRETEVERNLDLAAKGKVSHVFADTKEQNGCCRIGQTKVFARNIAFFATHADPIRRVWLEAAQKVHCDRAEVDLHLHMISTIVSAEDVYKGNGNKHPHKDEMWIWIAEGEVAYEHLKRFLHAFQASPALKGQMLEVEFCGKNADELGAAFRESFPAMRQTVRKGDLPIAVVRFSAGLLNSRKAMVTPFLPHLNT